MSEAKGEPKDAAPAPAATPTRTVRSSDLLGDARVLRIEHNGEIYVLRITRNGRLILTK
jgi:hemin uptake protein HemP